MHTTYTPAYDVQAEVDNYKINEFLWKENERICYYAQIPAKRFRKFYLLFHCLDIILFDIL